MKNADIGAVSFGVPCIIPSTRNAYNTSTVDGLKRKQESEAEKRFSILVKETLEQISIPDVFPTENGVFVLVIQFFSSEKEYYNHDIDNICRTVLNNLDSFIQSDTQVKTLLGCKEINKRVKGYFAYISVNALKENSMPKVMKDGYMENGVQFYENILKRK